MSDFYNPIRRIDPHDREHTLIPPVQEGKQSKEDSRDLQQDAEKKNKMLHASIILFYKRLFQSMMFSRNPDEDQDIDAIAAAAEKFRDELEKLKTSDQTDNPHYAEALSSQWEILLKTPPNSPLEPFIKLANTYPFGELHSLGFYLSQHAGDEWLPFPFLEILKKLHQGYVLRKANSELNHLLTLLDQGILALGL